MTRGTAKAKRSQRAVLEASDLQQFQRNIIGKGKLTSWYKNEEKKLNIFFLFKGKRTLLGNNVYL